VSSRLHPRTIDATEVAQQLHELADMLDQEWADYETHRLGLNGDQK
jgi:hypothetical protein